MSPRFAHLTAFATSLLLSNTTLADPNWENIPGKEIPLFYPGPSAYEWVVNLPDHTGARKLTEKKQNCFDCHESDADVIGSDVVAGKKVGKARVILDTSVPAGRRGFIPVTVKAAHDSEKIFLRFEWESLFQAAPEVKPDANNEIKLSMIFDGGNNDEARMTGCWMSCHMDLRTMPDSDNAAKKHLQSKALGWNDGVTKYLPISRKSLSIAQQPRGGWRQVKRPEEIRRALQAGQFLDLMQYRSGGGKPIDGYVLESRHMDGGKSLINAAGKRDGNKWTITFERTLESKGLGDHRIQAGQTFNFGIAIHENFSHARFHHVSLGYTLGLDNPSAFINAVNIAPSLASAPSPSTVKP